MIDAIDGCGNSYNYPESALTTEATECRQRNQ